MSTEDSQNIRNHIKITFVFEGIELVSMEKQECEILAEIRPYLLENPILKFSPNFLFFYKTNALDEQKPISEQIREEGFLTVELRLAPLVSQTARLGVASCCNFFLEPLQYLNDGFIEFNTLIGRIDYLKNIEEEQELLIESPSSFSSLSMTMPQLDQFTLDPSQNNHIDLQFFTQLSLSKYTPIISKDPSCFLLLDFTSLEGQFFCLKVEERGFCVLKATESHFNDSHNSVFYRSLFEALRSISPLFSEQLNSVFNLTNQADYDKFIQSPSLLLGSNPGLRFFKVKNSKNPYQLNLESLIETLKDLPQGLSLRTYRDWNEEFQNCRQLPADDLGQQIQKTKILRRIASDFKSAAIEAARAVLSGHLTPLNPSTNKLEECFVFNNLFITFAVDSLDWSSPKQESSPSCYSCVNADIINAKQVYSSDLEGVNIIHSIVVDMLGKRMVVQAMVSGILHFDQTTWNLYGSVDEGKTISNDAGFEPIFERLCGFFLLKKGLCYQDESGKEILIHGSPEVKGIKAGDGRRYVMDLFRLSLRDSNFSDKTKHECCLIRPELLKNFAFLSNIEDQIKEGKDQQEQSKENPYLKKDELCFDPSLFTLIESKSTEEEKKVMEDRLAKLSSFLINNSIQYLMRELSSQIEVCPSDADLLIELFHRFGINVRYLGNLHSRLTGPNNAPLRALIEKTAVLRAIRKLLRFNSQSFSLNEWDQLIVYYINAFVGNQNLRTQLDDKISVFLKKAKNDRKGIQLFSRSKKHKQVDSLTLSAPNKCFLESLYSTEELIIEINKVIEERYGFKKGFFEKYEQIRWLRSDSDKLSFIRGMADYCGFCVAQRQYHFRGETDSSEYPFKINDIIERKEKVKGPEFELDLLKYNYRLIEAEIGEKRLKEALSILKSCLGLVINTYGFFNGETVDLYSRMASLLFGLGQKEEAFRIQIIAVKISQRVHGLDNRATVVALNDLAGYCIELGKKKEALILLKLVLQLSDLIAGEGSSFSLNTLTLINSIKSELKEKSLNLIILEELVHRVEGAFGETNERLVHLLNSLASERASAGFLKEAALLQARQLFILKKIVKEVQGEHRDKVIPIFQKKIEEAKEQLELFKRKEKEVLSKS